MAGKTRRKNSSPHGVGFDSLDQIGFPLFTLGASQANTVVQSRSEAGTPRTLAPAISKRAAWVGVSNPEMIRSIVVFPEPLSPKIVRNSPRLVCNDTRSRT